MNITPIIVPHDWSGAGTCYCHPLLECSSPGTPFIAYGEDTPLQTSYVLKSDIRSDNQILEIRKTALNNLKNRDSLKSSELGVKISGGLEPYYMRCVDDLTASDILNAEFLNKVHEELDSKILFAALPNKNTLLIGTNQDDMASFAEDHFLDSEKMSSVPITANVYKIIDGKVISTASTRNKEFYNTSLIPRAQMFPDGKGGALQISVHFVNSQLLLERVTLAMDAYSHVFSENESFGGNIYFKIIMEKVIPEIEEKLKSIEDRIQSFIDHQGLKTLKNESINIFLEACTVPDDGDEIEELFSQQSEDDK
ncbi:MAG: hypothetical protein NE327_20555 [Lentisphaeraceae bacterium]|nr:hypothetical protein [Lentisphaeraceae bacterium]